MNTKEIYLEHALVTVRNIKASLEFYGSLFPEWTTRWEGTAEGDGKWVHFGPAVEGQPSYLSLYEVPNAQRARGDHSVRVQHIGFAHPNVKGLVDRLASVSIRSTEERDDGKFRRAYFEDPDGHELEFVQKL
jgi:catechol 2,3-dioxygenase-like lactoylglutathione lyase family enzyme